MHWSRKVVLKKTCFCWRDAPSTVVWALKSTDTNTATLPIKASQFRIIPENTFHYPLPTILNGLISILELGYSYCSNLYNLICLLAPTLSDIVGFPVAPKADQSRFQPLDFGFWGFWGFWIVFCRVLTSEKILNLLSCPNSIRYSWFGSGPQRQTRGDSSQLYQI